MTDENDTDEDTDVEFEDYDIIDANGALYKVGWDSYGWFSIQRVKPSPTMDSEYVDVDEGPVTIPPDKVQPVIDLMSNEAYHA